MSELYGKYLVLKVQDIEKYCSDSQKEDLAKLIHTVAEGRASEGKGVNDYWVVNRDENYADIVKKLVFVEISPEEVVVGSSMRKKLQIADEALRRIRRHARISSKGAYNLSTPWLVSDNAITEMLEIGK